MDEEKYLVKIQPSTIKNCYMITLNYYKNGVLQDSITEHIEQRLGGLLSPNISYEDAIQKVLPYMMKKVNKDFDKVVLKEISSLQDFANREIKDILTNKGKYILGDEGK